MKVLVLNAGSSSIKYQVLVPEERKLLMSGLLEKIGEGSPAHLVHQVFHAEEKPTRQEEQLTIPNHKIGIHKIVELLSSLEGGIEDVGAVGHRVVHGGDQFKEATVINDEVLETIKQVSILAPIHNPPSIACIEEARHKFAKAVHVAVFDTTFHHTLPEHAYLYAVPYSWYQDHKIRRYGFHGTSHQYISEEASKLLCRDLKELKLITLHLGNGASICAIKGGQSVDTSMGLTPLEGLIMGTRSGDVDPAIITYAAKQLNKSAEEIEDILNHNAGLKGMADVNDMREIVAGMHWQDPAKSRAYDCFCYRVKKYIGAYLAALEGADAIVFSAGIGENSTEVRATVCKGMEFFGLELDEEKNKERSKEPRDISTSSSKIRVLVIPTNEELSIALQTLAFAREMVESPS
jgi:acetate kinase